MTEKTGQKAPTSPRRLLVLTPATSTANAQCTNFLTSLTSQPPAKDISSFSGYTSHPPFCIRNKYYSADVNLWCDEIPLSISPATHEGISNVIDKENEHGGLEEWTEQMCSRDAAEVRRAIGAIVLLLPFSATSRGTGDWISYIESITRLRDQIDDEEGREVTTIAVLQDTTPSAAARQLDSSQLSDQTQTLEDTCLTGHGVFGWDFVGLSDSSMAGQDARDPKGSEAKRVDEYGEKTGMSRVVEVLEQNDWLSLPADDNDDEFTADEQAIEEMLASVDDFGLSEVDGGVNGGRESLLGSNPYGSKTASTALSSEDKPSEGGRRTVNAADEEDAQIEQFPGLVQRVITIREAGTQLPREQRQSYAKREVAKIVRELNLV